MKTRDKSKRTDRTQSELRVAEIDYNPAPGADERLRRLITLLVKVAANRRHTVLEHDSPAQIPTPNAYDEVAA